MQARRFHAVRAALVAGSVVVLALALWAPVAGAGISEGPDAPLTIVKTVSGPVPEGTTFTATLECDDPIIDDGEDGTDTVTVTFDETGQPTSEDTFEFNRGGTCTVTETDDGGAATTTYACEGSFLEDTSVGAQQIEEEICPEAGPQDDPIEVNIITPAQEATVTIDNTFVAPPTTTTTTPPVPSPAVIARPTFTG